MMEDRKYHINGKLRLVAFMLLVVFMSFSVQIPLLNKEVHKNNPITEHVLVALQESITANSIYHAPSFKYDFGQQRVVLYFLKLVNWSLLCLNSEPEILHKPTVGNAFPLSTIPTYLFDRVLRI